MPGNPSNSVIDTSHHNGTKLDFDKAKAAGVIDKMTDKQDRLRLQEKIRRTQHKVVDALESIVGRLSPQPAPARSLAAERRQVANLLGAWQFCAKRACCGAHCCLGEPMQCLRLYTFAGCRPPRRPFAGAQAPTSAAR